MHFKVRYLFGNVDTGLEMCCTGVLTIYTGKPEIPVRRSNGSRHPVFEASENLGFDLY